MRVKLSQTIIFLFISITIIGQTTCDKKAIIGEWKYIATLNNYANNDNLDSISNVALKTKVIAIWTFKEDGNYTYNGVVNKHKSKGKYHIDTENCIIILGTKNKATEESTYYIKQLDNKCMLLNRRNPKGDNVNYLLWRQ